MTSLLDTDLKHCDLDTAAKVVKEYDKSIQEFLNANTAIYDDFLKAEKESDYNLAEYLWYGYWDLVVDYLRKSA
jgi:hypothetical protein